MHQRIPVKRIRYTQKQSMPSPHPLIYTDKQILTHRSVVHQNKQEAKFFLLTVDEEAMRVNDTFSRAQSTIESGGG